MFLKTLFLPLKWRDSDKKSTLFLSFFMNYQLLAAAQPHYRSNLGWCYPGSTGAQRVSNQSDLKGQSIRKKKTDLTQNK
jgi:hypothetical protein